MYSVALKILAKLNGLGYEAYIIGGFARDLYLGIPSDDIDICTSAKPNIIKRYFNVIKDNSKFGSVIIKEHLFEYEITTFRKDVYQSNRYPKISFVKTLKEDLKRRDFIINTLCINRYGNFVDLLGAIADLDNKIIKSVDHVNNSFQEDPLRILRAIRFACKLDFHLDDDIIKAIKIYKNNLKCLSKKKLNIEINKILIYKNGLNFLKNFGLEDYIL